MRPLTRARWDLIQTRTAGARQRLHDELVVLFPAVVRFLPSLPGRPDRGDRAVLDLLEAYRSVTGAGGGTRRRLCRHRWPRWPR